MHVSAVQYYTFFVGFDDRKFTVVNVGIFQMIHSLPSHSLLNITSSLFLVRCISIIIIVAVTKPKQKFPNINIIGLVVIVI